MRSQESRKAPLDVGEITALAVAFRDRLKAVKAALAPRDFDWYRYDSLANFGHLERLLTGRNRFLLELAGNDPMLDVGCADGDLAFFLESLGARVDAIDHPVPNHNGMAGIRALKEALGSSVTVNAVDLDHQFQLPKERYGLVLLLGVLYHLKNPFYVLDALSRRAPYCLISTRIARTVPAISASVRQIPIAYLLDAGELNADDTNFWVFTEVGFRRLLKRTNWMVLDYISCGDTGTSDPVSVTRDERAFCLVRSSYALKNFDLLSGWHEPEGSGWRWTEQRFSVLWRAESGAAWPRALRAGLYVAPILLGRGPLVLSAEANGIRLPPEVLRDEGKYLYERAIPAEAARGDALRLDFSLDRAVAGGGFDPRERGIVVHSLEFE